MCGLRAILTASGIGLLACGLLAQGSPSPTLTVPAIREPHHTVKLENHYARVLDVTVPILDSTLFHIHPDPYVWVSIGAATLNGQVLGTNEFTDIITKDGEVRYSDPVTHRVGNVGPTNFRNITIEIIGRDTTPAGMSSAPTTGSGLASAFDNALVHVDRLTLAPGQSSGRHLHGKSGLLVAVHDGSATVDIDGRSVRLDLHAGDFDWHTGALVHSITNTGSQTLDAVEVTWK
jgi:mannose-6-phosphate isomerase-like protein (cupin superfamily)